MDDLQAHGAPPESVSQLLDRLDRIEEALPKRLRQCADFLRANLDLVAVSTVAELAEAAQVAPSAFMRFCHALGFSGYSGMQALFRVEYTQRRPDYAARLQELRDKGATDAARLMVDFAEAGHKSLSYAAQNLDPGLLQRIVERMLEAGTIHIIGRRRALAVASYMSYLLDKMEQPCLLHAGVGGMEFAHAIRPGDLLFAITFAPFSPETLALAERAHKVGASVVLLTDSAECPAAGLAGAVAVVREIEVGSFRVPTASLTLITALAVALGERGGPG